MTKKKLLLGLLVFAIGVMFTACGDKNSTSNTTTNNEDQFPKSWEDDNCEDCQRIYEGTLNIVDGELYLEAFGYQSGNSLGSGDNIFDVFLQEAILEPVGGLLVCGTKVFLTEAIAELAGIDNIDIECTQEDINLFDNGNTVSGDELDDSSPSARIRVTFENGEARRIDLLVQDAVRGEDDVESFYRERTDVFVNTEDTLLLQNADGRIRFGTTNGRLIGEFND